MTDPTTEPSGVRRRLGDARATIVGTTGLRNRVAKQTTAITRLRERVDRLRERADRVDERLKALEATDRDAQRSLALDAAERERRDAQFGTVEVRLADLEQRLEDARAASSGGAPDDQHLAAGRSLLDEVRTEHARIRARMQVVSAYEERLRRVEESVAELYPGDTRHPV